MFGMTVARFLGSVVHGQGIQVDPKNLEAMQVGRAKTLGKDKLPHEIYCQSSQQNWFIPTIVKTQT
jgi:hypothetical protein